MSRRLILLALALCACGTGSDQGPREAAQALLARLASNDVAGVCRSLTASAVRELAQEFGGPTCRQTATTAARYVTNREGERAAVRAAVVRPTVDIPLSPAPYRSGATTVRLRVAFRDPVLDRRQQFDLGLQLADGRWRVTSGIEALFTLLAGRGARAPVRG